MKQTQSGFTLIELMIVVVIIGLLAAIAIPQYGDYTQRTKVSSAVTGALGWKTAISLCIQDQGVLALCGTPGTNGVPPDAGAGDVNFTSSITTGSNAEVTITTTGVDNSNNPLVVTMTPTLVSNGSTIDWTLTGSGCSEPNRSINCKDF